MPPLYPLVLIIETPHGTADFTVSPTFPDPRALKATRVRAGERLTNLRGRGLTRFPEDPAGWDLRLAIPAEFGVPFAVARALQACAPGDTVTITENLTQRDTLRVWQHAVVMDADSGDWAVGNPQDGDFFTIAMNFFVAGG